MSPKIAQNVRFLLLAVVVGCSDDPTEPSLPNLTGTWTYSATGLSGSSRSCTLAPFTLTITQTGSILSGATAGGTLTCTNPSQTTVLPVFQITNGEVYETASGPRMSFRLVNGGQTWWHLQAKIESSARVADRVSILGMTGSPIDGDFVMSKQ